MSYSKGYTYDNINTFCKKYDCFLLTTKEEIYLKPKEINIKSACCHITTTSFKKLTRRKIGIYCDECITNMKEAKCFGCNEMFDLTDEIMSVLFCSKNCENFKNRNQISYTYKLIKDEYEKEQCVLLTTEEEFNKDKSCKKFKIKGKCGCIINYSNFITFLFQKSNINCRTCTNKNTSIKNKSTSKIDGIPTNMIIEKSGVDLIREICKDTYIVMKTGECCEADILVKPINNDTNMYLPIQLKVTSKKKESGSGSYNFNIKKKYNNMLLLFVCIEDNKLWLFESNDEKLTALPKISIGAIKSKYDYAVVDTLIDNFNYWYDKKVYNITLEKGNIPQSKNAKLEREYIILRENTIKFLTFEHNKLDGLSYDFKVNDHKIQEKVCSLSRTKKMHEVHISKSGGVDNNKIPYCVGDNDFYWFNIQDRNTFYVIPEIELIDRGFISIKNSYGKTNLWLNSNEHWLSTYKFFYDSINEKDNREELLALINT